MLKITTIIALFFFLLHAEFREAESGNFTYDMAQRYCKEHGDGKWRVPHIQELFMLRGDKQFSKGRSFWAANLTVKMNTAVTTGSEGEDQRGERFGYTFYLQDGDIAITPVTKTIGVICTDQPYKQPDRHYEVTDSGIIDHDNGILWHSIDAIDKKAKYSFEAAQQFCESLQIDDRSWRLPTLDELYSIVTYEWHRPTLDTSIFGHMMHRYYWSDEFNEQQSYVVGFKLGSVATSNKKNHSYLRCVSDLDE